MKKAFLSIVIFIITLEVSLRVTRTYNTATENEMGIYVSPYKPGLPSWFHHWAPNTLVDNNMSEFRYQNQYNELGHREIPYAMFEKDTASIKVICLGDSFTEGDGAPVDSTWVKKVDALSNKKLSFYNAGVCGSDVFFNNKMLEHKLLPLRPKVVVECVNTSDLSDVMWFGGNERFKQDGTTVGKKIPSWETPYKYSHIIRAVLQTFFKFNSSLVVSSQLQGEEKKSAMLIDKEIESTAMICQKNNIQYYLVVHPCPYEIGKPTSGTKTLIEHLGTKPYTINLFGALDSFYKTNNIKQFSHAINGHYNPKGYWVMGEKIYTELAKRDSLFANN